jgi:hypothetical protein
MTTEAGMVTPVVAAMQRIIGRRARLVTDPGWMPDHERRARRRRAQTVVCARAAEAPPIVWVRVRPVEPKRLRA